MIVAICVDDRGGTMFNRRRQSQDRVLREKVLSLAAGRELWMDGYSARLFGPEHAGRISVAEDFLDRAGPGAVCFAEGAALVGHEARIEQIVLFRWNRLYPSDTWFDIPLEEHGWRLTETEDFSGSSHEKITREVYVR